MSFTYVDSHCHLDTYASILPVLRNAEAAGTVVVAMTELPSHQQRLETLAGNRPALRVAVGMHPLSARRITSMEEHIFLRLLRQARYVGEIGLDYTVGKEERSRQQQVFDFALRHAAQNKILSIHSRRAEADVIAALADANASAPILHWYSGPLKHIGKALDVGCYFSINPSMVRSKRGQTLLRELPADRVLTETDGPYTRRPGGQPTEPSDVPALVSLIAHIWRTQPETARDTIWNNMARLAATSTHGTPERPAQHVPKDST